MNVRSDSLESRGDGKLGKKASGLLCVNNVLYLWARNVDNAQLAWSNDHGQSWEWADWKFTTSFGCPTFLNFGKNYAGARDEFAYVYSQDCDSAYQPADHMVLARVPQSRLRQRNAYEFFAGFDAQQRPCWSSDVSARTPVFTHRGNCYRSSVTYSAALKRYLWVQILPGIRQDNPDTRFEGGMAIFDAPEPWGPWTTASYNTRWDVGPGETASFPSKWMSADGRSVALVFSGNDAFSVRTATLHVANQPSAGSSVTPSDSQNIEHVMVYHEPRRFGGWPANHGIWSWGDEILVGFSAGDFKDLGPARHAIDRERPEEHLLRAEPRRWANLDDRESVRAGNVDSCRQRTARCDTGRAPRETMARLSRWNRLHAPGFRAHRSHDRHQRGALSVLLFHQPRAELDGTVSVATL